MNKMGKGQFSQCFLGRRNTEKLMIKQIDRLDAFRQDHEGHAEREKSSWHG